jgi:ribosome-associated toxin RatA of RatAB toxin-antitoxin module
MSQLSTQVQIKAPADKLWKALVDLDSLPQWVPDNTGSETASQNSETMPAPRYYDANPFHDAEDRATDREEGHHYAYEVKNIGPIKSAYNRFSLNPVGEGETVLTQALDFQMKLGPVGSLMDTLVFRPQFRKQMEQSLAALKEYVEHNEAVDSSVDLALTA